MAKLPDLLSMPALYADISIERVEYEMADSVLQNWSDEDIFDLSGLHKPEIMDIVRPFLH